MIEIILNAEKLAELQESLGIVNAPKFKLTKAPTPEHLTRGTASHAGTVEIFYDLMNQAVDQLRFVQSQIVRTLLHEMRHIWQFENWTSEEWEEDKKRPYTLKRCEIDANDFAAHELANWRGLVKVKRTNPRTRLGKLAAAERIVRQ